LTLARAPSLPADLIGGSTLLCALPTPQSGPAGGYGFPPRVVPVGHRIGPPKFPMVLSARAVSFHPGEFGRCV